MTFVQSRFPFTEIDLPDLHDYERYLANTHIYPDVLEHHKILAEYFREYECFWLYMHVFFTVIN